jgi:hypothetical protein
MADFMLEPRGPFTLASAARFVAGWPPGQAHTGEDEIQLDFLVDDWSGPARVVLRQDGEVIRGAVEADNEPRAIAQAALEGKLDREPLLAADTDDAFTQLLELPGAGLILLRRSRASPRSGSRSAPGSPSS